MSAYSDSYRMEYGDRGPRHRRRHGCRSLNMRPYEIAAMVVGFVVFWPIGLGILFFKIWQRKLDDPRDLASAIRDTWQSKWEDHMGSPEASKESGHGFERRMRSSGNAAFDDWRSAELARLEEEHQKLVAAEREFHDFMDSLRRAKDKEEFDRFMAARQNGQRDQRPSE